MITQYSITTTSRLMGFTDVTLKGLDDRGQRYAYTRLTHIPDADVDSVKFVLLEELSLRLYRRWQLDGEKPQRWSSPDPSFTAALEILSYDADGRQALVNCWGAQGQLTVGWLSAITIAQLLVGQPLVRQD